MLNNIMKAVLEANIKDSIRIGVLSDTRPVRGHIWKEMLDELFDNWKLDAVVNGGDFTDWSRKWEYKEYYEHIEKYKDKMLHVIGNHDDRFFGPSYFKKYFGDTDICIKYGKWNIVLLRNTNTWSSKCSITKKQSEWLDKILSDDYNKTCIFVHSPLEKMFPMFNNNDSYSDLSPKISTDKNSDVILKADIVVAGHAHMFAIRRILMWDGFKSYVISGGGAPNLYDFNRVSNDKNLEAWSINHSLLLDLNQNGSYEISMVRRGGDIHPDYIFKSEVK